jgi:hypothetical protein
MINILPYKQKKLIDRLRILRVVTTTLWAVIFLVGSAMLLLVPLLVTTNSRFAITEEQIRHLEQSGIVISPVDVASIRERTNALLAKLAASLPPSPTEYVAVVRGVQGPDITISGYSMGSSEPRLEIVGTAATREGLQRFIATLEKHQRVASVESPVSNYVKRTNSSFTITVVFQ